MSLKQYYLGCLSHASYLVADEESGVGAVVDPQRDVDQYLADARRLGIELRHVLLTHFHADFVSGHLELRARTGATIHVGRSGVADFEYEPLEEGKPLHLGRLRLEFLETPGHTPEGISIVVHEREGDAHPHAVLTGDTLFIGDVGRPDLMASSGVTAEELAGMLYDSLHGKLLRLPDETLVYPAHGAGSLCGRSLSTETVSTIGEQRRTNPMLQPMSREAFVRLATEDLPEAPAYFAHAVRSNRSLRPTLDAVLGRSQKPLGLDEVLARRDDGAQILDVRAPEAYARAHLKGSINVGLAGRYASWAGTVLSREHPIVIVADPGQEGEAAMRLGRIGYDQVEGYLEGGAFALSRRPDLVARTTRLEPGELAQAMRAASPPLVLDVREHGEVAESRLEGSLVIPLPQLARRLHEIPRTGRIVIHCAGGYRSMIAASMLEAAGHDALADLRGGMSAWRAAGEPVVEGVAAR